MGNNACMHKYIVVGGFLILVAGGVGMWAYRTYSVDTDTAALTDLLTVGEGGTVELVSDSAQPALSDPIFADEVPKEIRAKVTSNIEELHTMLTNSPGDFNAWLDLALNYKMAGDMRAAEAIWIYLTDAAPGQSISAHNLGTLYHLTFKRYEDSERYFEMAIAREPQQLINYLSFHELYRYSYQTDSKKAVEVLERALKALPGNPDALLTLGAYYRDEKGDTKKAIEYYLEARDAVQAAGNRDLVQRIEADIQAMR